MDYAKRLEKVLNGVWWHYPFMIEHVIDQVGVTEYSIQRWWADKINLKEKSVNILNSGFGFYSIPFAKERGAVEINTYDMDPMTKEIIMGSNHDLCNIVFDHEDFKQADKEFQKSGLGYSDLETDLPGSIAGAVGKSVSGAIDFFDANLLLEK